MTFNELMSKVRNMAEGIDPSGVGFLDVQVNINGENSGVFYFVSSRLTKIWSKRLNLQVSSKSKPALPQ